MKPTPHNAPTRAYLAQREGIERAAFTARDAAAGVAELQARGIAATGPVDFGRPVTLPDGREAGRIGTALAYVGGSVILSLVACWLGITLGRAL